MNLRGVVSISGKPGLFKVISQNKTIAIVESLDNKKLRQVVGMNTAKLSTLEDITIFGQENDLKLVDVLAKLAECTVVPNLKEASNKALHDFFKEVAPTHNPEKVYTSDIKKIIHWFNLLKDLPLFHEQPPESIAPTGASEVKKQQASNIEEKVKPVSKSAGKASVRLSQKSK